MIPQTNLERLLKAIDPSLKDGEFVFCSLDTDRYRRLGLDAVAFFREDEGLSVVVRREAAERLSLPFQGVWALITCQVCSDLSAVGFLSAILRPLADAGISVNPVAAFYHDHLFVPLKHARLALDLLKTLGIPDQPDG